MFADRNSLRTDAMDYGTWVRTVSAELPTNYQSTRIPGDRSGKYATERVGCI